MKRLILHLLTIGLAASFIQAAVTFAQQAEVPHDDLNVRIGPSNAKFRANDNFQFTLTLTNVGSKSFLIPSGAGADLPTLANRAILHFYVTKAGKPVQVKGYGWAMDSFCQEYKNVDLQVVDVFTEYIFIPSKTSYVQKFDLPSEYESLKPGRYVLSVDYSPSFPPGIRGSCTQWSSESIKHFPFPAWTGRAQTNSIAFDILPDVPKSKKP